MSDRRGFGSSSDGGRKKPSEIGKGEYDPLRRGVKEQGKPPDTAEKKLISVFHEITLDRFKNGHYNLKGMMDKHKRDIEILLGKQNDEANNFIDLHNPKGKWGKIGEIFSGKTRKATEAEMKIYDQDQSEMMDRHAAEWQALMEQQAQERDGIQHAAPQYTNPQRKE